MTKPLIFISYSHKDETEKDKLLAHLGVLENSGLIDLWSEDRIRAGSDWAQEFHQAIDRASVAVLLISANFLNSNFILDTEISALLQQREQEGVVIFPVIAKACAWKRVEWLAKMQVKPRNGIPVWGDSGRHVDEDLSAIAEEIMDIVERISNKSDLDNVLRHNDIDKKLRDTSVFIGSVGHDLQDYQRVAIEICTKLGFTPVTREFFEEMTSGAIEKSIYQIVNSDLYIGIFAHRYGYIEQGYNHSIIETEFDTASKHNLDQLCYFINPEYPWPPTAIDYRNHALLQEFKSRLNHKIILSEFTTVKDFADKLSQALIEWQRKNTSNKLDEASSQTTTTTTVRITPPLPELFIGREKDLHQLKIRLGIGLNNKKYPLTIIRGWPGVGKTTLVNALAYDTDINQAFPDGILWASLGQNADVLVELVNWGRMLGLHNFDSSEMTLEKIIGQVRALLHNKKMLLIVDDVWESDDAIPFKVAGPQCATVFTSRFLKVATELTLKPDDLYLLEHLDEKAGVELLEILAPNFMAKHTQEAYQLVSDLEGLPLALRVVGRLLEHEISSGFDITDTLAQLRESSKLLEVKAPDDRFDPHTGTTPTVNLLLKQSTDLLNEYNRQRFAELGIFAPKPATFDLETMAAIWLVDDPKPIARELTDRGLLEPIIGSGRFQIHAVLIMHAQTLLDDMEA